MESSEYCEGGEGESEEGEWREGRGRVKRESGGRRKRAEKEWHISVQSLYVFQQIHPCKNCQQHMTIHLHAQQQ